MIVGTNVILARLEAMPDAEVQRIVNEAWEAFEFEEESWPGKLAPDRASFAALLRALTDDWPDKRDQEGAA